jgi:hypothetical protein
MALASAETLTAIPHVDAQELFSGARTQSVSVSTDEALSTE